MSEKKTYQESPDGRHYMFDKAHQIAEDQKNETAHKKHKKRSDFIDRKGTQK